MTQDRVVSISIVVTPRSGGSNVVTPRSGESNVGTQGHDVGHISFPI